MSAKRLPPSFARRSSLLLCLGAALLLAGPSPAADPRPVPEPSLEGADKDLQERVRAARERIAQLSSEPPSQEPRSQEPPSQEPSPEAAEAYGELGKLYLHYGFLDAAEPAFTHAAALADDPSSPWTYYRAVTRERAGDLEGAAADLRQVLGVREGNLPAVLRLAGALLELGQGEEAEFLYRAALQSPLGKAAGHAGLGRAALDAGKPREAIAHFEAALEAQPEATALRYQLGLAYRDAGELARAEPLLKQPGGQEVQFPDPAMIQLRLQLAGAGSSAEAGGIAARQGDLETAVDSYREALAQNPDDLQTRRSLAASLFELRDLDAAEKEFREILRRDPENASAHMELGSVAAARDGDPRAGLEHFQKAVELAPEFREARLRLANALAVSGRLEDTLPHLRKVVELDPRDADGRLRLARALLETRRADDAAKEVAALLAQEPDHLDGILLRGRIHAVKGNPEAAEREFTRVTELSSASRDQRARASFNMALLRRAQGRPAEAVDFYRRTLELDGEHRQALFGLASLMTAAGRPGDAARLYGRLFQLEPGRADVRYRWAVSLMGAGELESASQHFEALYRAQPKNLDVALPSALLLAELDRGDEAAERLLATLSQTSDKVDQARIRSTLGAVEIKNGRLERGLGYLREAAERAPGVAEVRKRYAEALAGEKRYAQAAKEYEAYAELVPDDAGAAFAHATCWILLERWSDAVDVLNRVTRVSSDVAATHLLARLLASAPDPAVRDGERAVQIAQAVFEAARNPAHGETLAMAMAAAGRFDEALTLQRRLLQEAEQVKFDPAFIERVRRNLERYEKQQPAQADW